MPGSHPGSRAHSCCLVSTELRKPRGPKLELHGLGTEAWMQLTGFCPVSPLLAWFLPRQARLQGMGARRWAGQRASSPTHSAMLLLSDQVWFSNRRARWRRWQETMATLDSRALDRAVTLTEPGARPASAFEEGGQ